MQEFLATSERRAELYWWFATLFAAPLNDEQIAEYDSYDVRSFLKSLSTLDPMREAVSELEAAIAHLLGQPDKEAALHGEFIRLFGAQGVALTTESHYLAGGAERMGARLTHLAISLADKYQPPFDSLSAELDLMGNLVIRAAEAPSSEERELWLAEQESLLHEQLLRWYPAFERNCHQQDQAGFYGASARLLGVFLTMDAHYLTLVKPAS